METRIKAQRETTGTNAKGLDFTIGQAETRPAHDPSPPILTPVGFQTTLVPSDDNVDDAEQHQEPSNITSESGNHSAAR